MSNAAVQLQQVPLETKYQRIKTIGKGSFGSAVLVKSKDDGRRYVAKEINLSQMSPKEKEEAKNEVLVLAKLNHPNIVRLRESLQYRNQLFIVMEYADGGDLDKKIKTIKKSGQRVSEDQILSWFVQIALALKHLHDKKILHRDLKSQNVFLTSKDIVKLGDFGISTVLRNTLAQAMTVCGTPYYFSPEICKNKPYNNKSDIWALGCILYELATGSHAFNGRTMFELMKSICAGRYPPLHGYSEDMSHLLSKMLNVNASLRLSIDNILRVNYVQRALRTFTEKFKEQQSVPPPIAVIQSRPPSGQESEDKRSTGASSSTPGGGGGPKGSKPVAYGGAGVYNLHGGPPGYNNKDTDALRKEMEKREKEKAEQLKRQQYMMEVEKKKMIEKEKERMREREREVERIKERHRQQQEKEMDAIRNANNPDLDKERDKHRQFQLDRLEQWREKEREKERQREAQRGEGGVGVYQYPPPPTAAPSHHVNPDSNVNDNYNNYNSDQRDYVRKRAEEEREKKEADMKNQQRQAYWDMRQEAEKNKQRWKQQYSTPWQTEEKPAEHPPTAPPPRSGRHYSDPQDELEKQRDAYFQMRNEAERNKKRLMEEWDGGKPKPSQVPELPDLPQHGGGGKPSGGRGAPQEQSPDERVDAMLNEMLNEAVYGDKERVPDEHKRWPKDDANDHHPVDEEYKNQVHEQAEEEFQTMKGLIDTLLAEGEELIGDVMFGDEDPLLN